jgi:hypothetical protein
VPDGFVNPTAPANISASSSYLKIEKDQPPSYDSVPDDFINPTAVPRFSMPSRPTSESNSSSLNKLESLPDMTFLVVAMEMAMMN